MKLFEEKDGKMFGRFVFYFISLSYKSYTEGVDDKIVLTDESSWNYIYRHLWSLTTAGGSITICHDIRKEMEYANI